MQKILVVEDDSDLVELIGFNLKLAGYSVGTASNGIEALKKARSLLPDLILLDLMLPELDGFAVCEVLRRTPETTAVPIVVLTAMSGQLARLNAIDAGASDYITKPFSPKDLVSRVQSVLDRCDGDPAAESPDRNLLVTNSPLSNRSPRAMRGRRETEDPGR